MKCDATCPTCGLYWTREDNEDCPRCETKSLRRQLDASREVIEAAHMVDRNSEPSPTARYYCVEVSAMMAIGRALTKLSAARSTPTGESEK